MKLIILYLFSIQFIKTHGALLCFKSSDHRENSAIFKIQVTKLLGLYLLGIKFIKTH
jgi:hypothetical protein